MTDMVSAQQKASDVFDGHRYVSLHVSGPHNEPVEALFYSV
jgi:hypothetical protein